jgi:hypothetical protein
MMKKVLTLSIVAFMCLVLFMEGANASEKFTWPIVGRVLVDYKADSHRGVDIAAEIGNEVSAAQSGKVFWIGKTSRGEPCITIEHGDGVSSTYLPVTARVKKGDSVDVGQVIGVVSGEGDPSSDVVHLHFGLYETDTRDDKSYLNPLEYLSSAPVESSSANDKLSYNEVVEPADQSDANIISPDLIDLKAETVLEEDVKTTNENHALAVDNTVGALETEPERQTSTNNVKSMDTVEAEVAQGLSAEGSSASSKSSSVSIGQVQTQAQSKLATSNNPISDIDVKTDINRDDTYHETRNLSQSASKPVLISSEDANNKHAVRVTACQTSAKKYFSREVVDNNILTVNPFASSSLKKTNDKISLINKSVGVNGTQSSSRSKVFLTQPAGLSKKVKEGWVYRAVSWEGLPGVIAALAIFGMVGLGIIKLAKCSSKIGNILQTPANASC